MEKETTPLQRNTSLEFVGITRIKDAQKQQINQFEAWAARGEWTAIHDNHYDWWMFPIDSPSSYGRKWSVYAGDIKELKQDKRFLRDYRRGVELLLAAWGWDLAGEKPLTTPAPEQAWSRWPVRLYKAAYSLWLFGSQTEFVSVRKCALTLIKQGEDFQYGGKDLSLFFTQGLDPYSRKQVYSLFSPMEPGEHPNAAGKSS